MPIVIQNPRFAKGEIDPALWNGADLGLYRMACRACRNWFVRKTGGVSRRPSQKFVDETRFPDKNVALIPFVFSTATGDTYILEFGELYMEVIRAGARVTDSSKAISGATKANPCVVTATSHGFSNGDDVIITGIVGMEQLNNRRFRIANVTTHTFELTDTSGNNIDSSAYGTWASGGTASRVYKIATPYAHTDVRRIGFAQSADLMVLVHSSHAPRQLTRAGHASWTLSTITFAPTPAAPTGVATAGGAASNTYKYKVTAILASTGEESLAGLETGQTVEDATQADPVNIQITGHKYQTDDLVYFSGVGGMTELNGNTYVIDRIDANNFELRDIDGTGFTAFTAGGTAQRPYYRIDSAAVPSEAAPHALSFDAIAGCKTYVIYREVNGVFGFIGIHELVDVPPAIPMTLNFKDVGVNPDVSDTPPEFEAMFAAAGDYPSAVAFHQQRLVLAASTNNPTTIWMSRTGHIKNFTTHDPLRDDDAITFALASGEVNPIRHLVSLRRLLALTGAAEWAIEGSGSDGTILPSAINARPYSHHGSGFPKPIIVAGDVLYVQARGRLVRNLIYDFGSDAYGGTDQTVLAHHLLRSREISRWAYSRIPHGLVWAVTSDGDLLAYTYLPEQEVNAWTRNDGAGTYEDAAVIPEGDDSGSGGADAVYVAVRRTVGGRSLVYIERMDSDEPDPTLFPESNHAMDAYSTLDGRNTAATTLKIAGGPPWTAGSPLTLTASAATFAATDTDVDAGGKVYTEYWVRDAAGNRVRLTPISYTSPTVITVVADVTVPVTLQAAAVTTWSRASRRISGLFYLEGREVAALGDGFVLSSPLNPGYPTVTVSVGQAIFSTAREVVRIGLAFTSDLEPLDIELPEGRSLAGKPKIVRNVQAWLYETSSLFAGDQYPADDTVTGLSEFQLREAELAASVPTTPVTGVRDVPLEGHWNTHGRTLLRAVDPLKAGVMAVIPSVEAS